MNLLEHSILRIIEVEDVTESYTEFAKECIPGFNLKEPMLAVTLECDCYGQISICKKLCKESEYKEILKQGCFLA